MLLWDVLLDSLVVKVELELHVLVALAVGNVEIGVEETCHEVVAAGGYTDAEFIKDTLILIKVTEL